MLSKEHLGTIQGFFSKFSTSTPVLLMWESPSGYLTWNCTHAWQLLRAPFLFELNKFKMSLLTLLESPLCRGKVTPSLFRSGVLTGTLFSDISECPETETIANTLWLVTNSKSCPNCKWVVCLCKLFFVFSLRERWWIANYAVLHKNIVKTNELQTVLCDTQIVTAGKLQTTECMLCDAKI